MKKYSHIMKFCVQIWCFIIFANVVVKGFDTMTGDFTQSVALFFLLVIAYLFTKE